MLTTTTCRITDIIIAIVTQSHINNTTVTKMFQSAYILSYGISILNPQHHGFFANMLYSVQIGWSISQFHKRCIRQNHPFYLSEDTVSFRRCSQ